MSEVRLPAQPRTEFGKGAARRLRRTDRVPAVLYGHGTAPRHISLPGHELMLALKTANALLALEMEGGRELALPKDVQRDPIRGNIEHVDLVLVRSGEKVVVDVPVHVVGDVASGGLLNVDHATLQVETEATHIPTGVEVDVSELPIGGHVTAADVRLPAGTTLVTDPQTLIVGVTGAPSAEALDAELAEAEAGAGIVHDEKSEPADTAGS